MHTNPLLPQNPLFRAICLVALALLWAGPSSAQSGTGGVFLNDQKPVRISSENGTLAFEREKVGFAPQSTGIENCVNISLTNTTDHPRLLTELTPDVVHVFMGGRIVTSGGPELAEELEAGGYDGIADRLGIEVPGPVQTAAADPFADPGF